MNDAKRNRFMRIIVFFDMPVTTPSERRAYSQFRKSLVKDGYLMLQESVYVKLAIDRSATEQITARLKSICPGNGIVQVLVIYAKHWYLGTEKTLSSPTAYGLETRNCRLTASS